MVNFCAVLRCGNRGDRDKDKSFYRLPSIVTHQGSQTKELFNYLFNSQGKTISWNLEMNVTLNSLNETTLTVVAHYHVSFFRAFAVTEDSIDGVLQNSGFSRSDHRPIGGRENHFPRSSGRTAFSNNAFTFGTFDSQKSSSGYILSI